MSNHKKIKAVKRPLFPEFKSVSAIDYSKSGGQVVNVVDAVRLVNLSGYLPRQKKQIWKWLKKNRPALAAQMLDENVRAINQTFKCRDGESEAGFYIDFNEIREGFETGEICSGSEESKTDTVIF